ncbi:MAG: iron export ABC transporter permease subunit FetB [Leptolyngbyaceae cyanobacterium CSU_1_3]|nr:iron export ABC transporter permease subunit FetB [Leptolyngbyaceae cyanobacterium CSU_1_3]
MNLPIHLLLAIGLMVAAIALSSWQKLGLEGNLALATGRAIAQLVVLGYLIAVVFALNSPWGVLAFGGAMLVVVTIVTRNRISQKIPRLWLLVGGSILVSTAIPVGYAHFLIVQPEVWYAPQVLIPLVGIVLGNAMNAAAIAGERLVSTLNSSRLEIETHLSLGATPQQAVANYRRDAIRSGVLPTLNSMAIVGLATLPDVMSGQLLGGADPIQATAYQILILFMLAFSTLLTTVLLTHGLCRQFFTRSAQLLLW